MGIVRPHKYGAKACEIDNVRFASQREGRRYSELKLLEKAGEIDALELQPRYPIEIRGEKVCTYVADFRYRDRRRQCWVVEDVKGMRTPVYKLKFKLMQALYGIRVEEV